MKYINALLGLVLVAPTLFADDDYSVFSFTYKTASQTCTGAGSTCSIVMNALGEEITLDVAALPVKKLGIIAKDTPLLLPLPLEEGTQKIYSYIPSEGELANTAIYLAFDNKKPRPGTRLGSKKVITWYRQLEGDAPNKWIDVGEISVSTSEKFPKEYPVVIKKNGNILTKSIDEKGQSKDVLFVLGKKDVNA